MARRPMAMLARAQIWVLLALACSACVIRDVVDLAPDGGPGLGSGDALPLGPDRLPVIPDVFETVDLGTSAGSCVTSFDCVPGAICNQTSDPEYQPWQPPGTCVPVTCTGSGECGDGGVCSAIGLCRPEVCESSADCTTGVCIGGACVEAPLPSRVTSCQLLMDAHALSSEAVRVEAVALDASGAVVPGQRFTFGTLDPSVMAVVDGRAVPLDVGTSTLTATHIGPNGVVCYAVAVSAGPVVASGVRVLVADSMGGTPIVGARVVWEGATTVDRRTDGRGIAEAPVAVSAVDWVVVEVAGRPRVAVRSPPALVQVRVPPPLRVPTAAGRRGGVLLDAGAGDLRTGTVLFGLDAEPLSWAAGWRTWSCGGIASVVDAPELGLSQETAVLPDGLVARIGTRYFSAGVERCPSGAMGDGCWSAVRGRPGPAARARLATAGRLSVISGVAGRISAGIGDGCATPVTALFLPWAGTIGAGVLPYEELADQPKVGGGSTDCRDTGLVDYAHRCQPDRAGFPVATAPELVTARRDLLLGVPALPTRDDGECPFGATVWSGLLLPGRGAVPLGMITAPTAVRSRECTVPGRSDGLEHEVSLAAGTVGLRVSARPPGTERAERIAGVFVDVGRSFSALVKPQPVAEGRLTFDGPFLAAPAAEVRAGRIEVELAGAASFLAVSGTEGLGWEAWLPAGVRSVALPASLGLTAQSATVATTLVRSPKGYEALVAGGLGVGLVDAAGEVAVAVRQP